LGRRARAWGRRALPAARGHTGVVFVWAAALDALTPPVRGQGPRLATRQMGWRRLFRSALKARAAGYEPRASLVRLMTTGEGDDRDEADALLLACSAPRRGTGVGKISGLSESEAVKVACSGIDRWVQLYGIARAIELFSLIGAWKPTPMFPDVHVRLLAATRLRQWLAHADGYEQALELVQRWDGLPHGMVGWRAPSGYHAGHEAIAYLFSGAPAVLRASGAGAARAWCDQHHDAATRRDRVRRRPSTDRRAHRRWRSRSQRARHPRGAPRRRAAVPDRACRAAGEVARRRPRADRIRLRRGRGGARGVRRTSRRASHPAHVLRAALRAGATRDRAVARGERSHGAQRRPRLVCIARGRGRG